MKVRYTAGRLSTEFEGNQVEVFGAIAQFQEVFEESECGKCSSTDLRLVVRTVDGNKYHEIHCKNSKCRAKLAISQHKNEEKTLYPKRKAGKNDSTGLEVGAFLPDHGWLRWDSQAKKAV